MADENVLVKTDQGKNEKAENIHCYHEVSHKNTRRLAWESQPPSRDRVHGGRHADDRDEKAGSAHFQDEVVADCSESWSTHDDDPKNDVSSKGENVDDH